ncbi:hypothetical protein EDD37DRAFT_463502 [Exophiala viscosa]|uniref:uncharacterized protein n=1 Tax=Exophiala viscosa TaxID=2486360 RepID=UPI0021A0E3E4|nr:hypothetical protein EDD37DRAFT_463502 [Exophiala viscosa]
MNDAFLEEAERMMDINDDIFNYPHPAETSGPSDNPELQLMGMPIEIREAILRHILVKEDSIQITSTHARRGGPYSGNSALMFVRPQQLETSILRVNKRTAQEATDILYGANVFESQSMRIFKRAPLKVAQYGIGPTNMAKIKFARFNLPGPTFKGPTWGHQSLLDFLCANLIKLKKLTFRTLVGSEMGAHGDGVKEAEMKRLRPVFFVAARVTKFHPTLRKAVWRRWSGSRFANYEWIKLFDFEDKRYIIGEFSVDLVPEGLEAFLKGSVIRKNACGEDMECNDMVINSRLVRQTYWHDNVERFALPNNATSSEVDVNEVEVWPSRGKYPV